MPPDFCWKMGEDYGVIPTGCPYGYFRSNALCYQNCQRGYTFISGVCWEETCQIGYANRTNSCYRSLFKWYFKKSYIPSSITNLSSLVPCPKGMYRERGGALCYRDCGNIGLLNCGIGACSAIYSKCAESISRIKDVFQGIANAISFVATLEGSSGMKAAKSAIKTGITRIGKTGVISALNKVKETA